MVYYSTLVVLFGNMCMSRELYPHQEAAKAKALKLGSMGLFLGCRTGKTLTTIRIIHESQGLPCLIISPLAAIPTWRTELLNEGVAPEDIVIVRPRSSNSAVYAKNKLLHTSAKYFLINFETVIITDALNIRSTWQPPATAAGSATGIAIDPEFRAPAWLGLQDWQAVIVDESYKISNGESRVAQYLLQRPKPGHQNRFCLSGTPAAENPFQYASQFVFMFGHFFSCGTVAEYMHKYWEWNPYKMKFEVVEKMHLEDIREYTQKNAFCVTMQELGLGCEIFKTSRDIEATEAQIELFNWLKLARTYTHKKTGELMEMEPGVRSIMSRQISAGIHPLTDEIISTAKIMDFIQYFKDTGQQLLVSSFFKPPIQAAYDLCQKHGIRAAIIQGGVNAEDADILRQRFQAGDLDIIIGQEDKIARGLDFSALGAIFILSASFSEEVREQLEERGQHVKRSEPYEIISQHTEGSIDANITAALESKKIDARFYLDLDATIKSFKKPTQSYRAI